MKLQKKGGFTLIELLVVILIIGILAAVALPQYQKAVTRSQNAQIKQLIRMITDAEKAYYMEHGKYAANFKDLDIDIPLTPVKTAVGGLAGACQNRVQGTDSARSSNDFYIALNSLDRNMSDVRVVGYISRGRYKCSGFGMGLGGGLLGENLLHCRESRITSLYKAGIGAFCEKVERSSWVSQDSNWRIYRLS